MSLDQPLVVIIGPSGSGKSSLVAWLDQHQLVQVIPVWTTRPRRPNEPELEHRFVDEPTFLMAEAEKQLLYATQPFDLSHWYGLPVLPMATRRPLLIVLRADAASLVR